MKVYQVVRDYSRNPLRLRRLELGLSRQEIARRLDVNDRSVGCWERGDTSYRSGHIRGVAAAYELGLQRAVEIHYELALGRELTGAGQEHKSVSRYTLSDWLRPLHQAQIARDFGCSTALVSNWINGGQVVGYMWLEALARLLRRTEAEVAWASYLSHYGEVIDRKRRREV